VYIYLYNMYPQVYIHVYYLPVGRGTLYTYIHTAVNVPQNTGTGTAVQVELNVVDEVELNNIHSSSTWVVVVHVHK
jgi:hypothetical protein